MAQIHPDYGIDITIMLLLHGNEIPQLTRGNNENLRRKPIPEGYVTSFVLHYY